MLSGDVHHAYLAEVDFRPERARAPVYQAVCSPFATRSTRARRAIKVAMTRAATTASGVPLARAAGRARASR